MPLFVSSRDMTFIDSVNMELVDDIVETPIIMYSLDPEYNSTNLYGETLDKIYKPGIIVNCLINHNDSNTDTTEVGTNVFQNVNFAIHRNTLKTKDFYPETGDVVKYNGAYFEIYNVIDNQLLAGRESLSHSIICESTMTNRSSINIRGNE